jgi:hypothetical protein
VNRIVSSSALSVAFVLGLFVGLSPVRAGAGCTQWDATGQWSVSQTNGISAGFNLQRTDVGLQGTASWGHQEGGGVFTGTDAVITTGSADGAINGDSFDVTVYWDNDTIGEYTGRVDPFGRLTGTTIDKNNPHSVAAFHSDQTFKCLKSAGAIAPSSVAPAVVDAAPGKALGRANAGPAASPASLVSSCEAARLARARNNAAAPGLEAQCRAQAPVKALGRATVPAAAPAAGPMSVCDAARAARARNNAAAPGLEAQCKAAGG